MRIPAAPMRLIVGGIRVSRSNQHQPFEVRPHPQEQNGEPGVGLSHHVADRVQSSSGPRLVEVEIDLGAGLETVRGPRHKGPANRDVRNLGAAATVPSDVARAVGHPGVLIARYAHRRAALGPALSRGIAGGTVGARSLQGGPPTPQSGRRTPELEVEGQKCVTAGSRGTPTRRQMMCNRLIQWPEIATVLRILGRDADLQSNCLPTSVSSARWSPPMLVYRRMGRDLDPSPLGERPSGNLARTAPACARAR